MLLSCHSLESLHFHNCRDILITGKLFSNDLVLNHVRKATPFFKELGFSDNCSYLSDALVARFVSLSPHLKYLSLAGTSVSFHGGIYKRFYPGDQNKFSELVLTFDNILRHINSHSSTIQHLDLSRTTINDKACKSISQVISGIQKRKNYQATILCLKDYRSEVEVFAITGLLWNKSCGYWSPVSNTNYTDWAGSEYLFQSDWCGLKSHCFRTA